MAKAKSEYEVEDLYITRLEELGYEYVSMKDYDDVIRNFREQFCKLNSEALIEEKGVDSLSDTEFERVVNRLDNHTIYDSAKILREKWVLELDNGRTVYVVFFTDDESKNIFQVTHQITMDKEHKDDVLYKNRYDVTILINGLPLIQTELKRPGIEINEAVNQINRYRRFSFRGLFRYIQLFIISNSTMTKYCANINENDVYGHKQDILKSLTFFWTDENNLRINKLMDFTNVFLTKIRITELLSKFYVIKETEPILMVMRPYQIYAVKRAFERIMMADMNGFVFHSTGSGKTLTSYKLATLLRDDRRIDKVFFLIDRCDLDDQTVEEYNSFEAGCVDQTEHTSTLVKALKDSSKTLIITTIQKMAHALRTDKYSAVMDVFKSKKCVFIIDECHRSQFGKMHAQIRKHFENGNYIGFTGTPIFAENKGALGQTTADIFNSGKLDSCIHRYMVKDAIADGNVLRFSVEYMRTFSVKQDCQRQGSQQLDDEEYCKKNGIDLDDLYHRDARIAEISEDILGHLKQRTRLENNNVYTAMFAVDQIPTLVKYYNYMKAHNPENFKIAAIFTYQANQDMEESPDQHASEQLQACMDDYNLMFGTDFDLSKFEAYRKDISKRMKQKDLPQVDLLLVVNMFLTGFDSKPTNTLFLDKNLVWHSLVQAYSRTNRVDKVTKQFGQIVTYRNIKKAQDEALKLFSGDGDPNAALMKTYDYYVAEYYTQVEALRKVAPTSDDAGNMQSEDDIRAFVVAFRTIARTLSIVKTFSKFSWADLAPALDEDEYTDYKSWYLYHYDKQKKHGGEKSTLADVDFNVELVRTDKINVVYILNLLKEVNRQDKSEMEKSVDLILREIERSDNEKMRYKKDIMKSFVQNRFFELGPDVDIVEAYNEYEKEVLQADIAAFAEKKGLPVDFVASSMGKFFADSKGLTKESLRQGLMNNGVVGLLKITSLINEIMGFLTDSYNKFTVEGE